RRHGPRLFADQPVSLGTTMCRKIEDRCLVGAAEVEIAASDDQFIAHSGRHRDRLSRRRNYLAVSDLRHPFFTAALRHPYYPSAVLVGPRLHDKLVVE